MFQPKLPAEKRAKSMAFSTGSESPIRTGAFATSSTSSRALSEMAEEGPSANTSASSLRFRASTVGFGTESLPTNRKGSPERAAQQGADLGRDLGRGLPAHVLLVQTRWRLGVPDLEELCALRGRRAARAQRLEGVGGEAGHAVLGGDEDRGADRRPRQARRGNSRLPIPLVYERHGVRARDAPG